jgi:hypothetical protein
MYVERVLLRGEAEHPLVTLLAEPFENVTAAAVAVLPAAL